MTRGFQTLATVALLCAGIADSRAVAKEETPLKRDYPIVAVPFTDVHVSDAFWSPRLELNRKVTIPYAFKQCEETGRIDNFAIAGKLKQGKFKGIFFNDSDVFKVMEGAAYALAVQPDPQLDKYLDDLIAKVAAAQEPDGYLYTARTLCGPDYMPPGGKERWSDMAGGHELYNVGHMYEAAAAHFQATGKRTFLNVAIKNANLVCSVFGPGRNPNPCGHPEVEIGLVKLYRAAGDEKYLQMAKFFIDTRGRAEGRKLFGDYCQDHKPLIEQTEAVGHSVRAGYVYAGMADVAALTGEDKYIQAIGRLWEDVVGRKLYVTGGIGAHGSIEGFGPAYELPNDTAYAETCANIANALWNQRLFLTHGDARYADVLERVIYNSVLSGWGQSGDRFFYPNVLESKGAQRNPWFDCACCPPNIARFMPSLPGYVYAHRDNALYVNLFVGGTGRVPLSSGDVTVKQETRYPWDGKISITVEPTKADTTFDLLVRVPGWARNEAVPSDLYRFTDKAADPPTLTINGKPATIELIKGYARIQRKWAKGDVVELNLPMPVRRIVAHPSVKADVGRVALQRGPIMFCAEGVDQKDGQVLSLVLADDADIKSEFKADLLGGVEVLHTSAKAVSRKLDGGVEVAKESQELTAVPYYAWANRAPGQMTIWLARDPAAAKPRPAPTLANTSRITASAGENTDALTDQTVPADAKVTDHPRFHVWPRKGNKEWVQFDLAKPSSVNAVEVFWFDDTGRGGCRVPESWKLLAKVNGEWKEVAKPSGYGIEKDRYNRTTFEPIVAEAMKIEYQLAKDFSTGIYEVRILPADGKPAAAQ